MLAGVDKQIKCTRLVQKRQEGHAGCDLPNYSLYFIVNFLDRLLAPFVVARGFLAAIVGILILPALVFALYRYVELPAFQCFSRIGTSHDNHKTLDVAIHEPRLDLANNLVQIVEQSRIGRCQNGESVLSLAFERFRHVNSCVVDYVVVCGLL